MYARYMVLYGTRIPKYIHTCVCMYLRVTYDYLCGSNAFISAIIGMKRVNEI